MKITRKNMERLFQKGKWVDEVISNEYVKLGNAIKFLEKLLDNTSQKC